jgi:hypothetical protein
MQWITFGPGWKFQALPNQPALAQIGKKKTRDRNDFTGRVW